MPITYIPYFPDPIQGQALLNNFTRTQRALKYRDNDKVLTRIQRGLPLYEAETIETVGENPNRNLLIRGECVAACAYLKSKNIRVDLVYIDPPFASGAAYAKKIYVRRNPAVAEAITKAEQELADEELRAFEETMYGDIWRKEDYLNWMYENLMAIKSVMSQTGMIFVHLDWHIGQYVKILLDEIFGEDNFRNEIVVRRIKKNIREREHVRTLNVATDSIFLYAMNDEVLILPPTRDEPREERWHAFDAPGIRTGMDYELFGVKPPPSRHWMRSKSIADKWIEEKRLRPHPKTGRPEYLIDASGEMLCDSLWDDIATYAFTVEYATEKSESLLTRIVEMSPSDNIVVADFFGGSGVTAKVANDLGRRFIHVDVGINSIQTTRDRLRAAGASFEILDIQDGVALFRNPAQTMEKLKTLITGLRNEDALDSFWEGALQDAKEGMIPVYVPNLLDHSQKVLDVPALNRILQEALPDLSDLPEPVRRVIIYYVDADDLPALEKFAADHNPTEITIEFRDLKQLLAETVTNDIVEYTLTEGKGGYTVTITQLISDRILQKIDAYNQKRGMNGGRFKQSQLPEPQSENGDADAESEGADGENGGNEPTAGQTMFQPIQVSDTGLELVELVSLDATNAEGAWHSDKEIKIDKNGNVIRDGKKTKEYWDASISINKKPLRLKVRNIAGDETILALGSQT